MKYEIKIDSKAVKFISKQPQKQKEHILRNIIPTFLAYTKSKYFEMFDETLNNFLQSDCLINIILTCCVEKILEYSLEELSEFENVNIKKLSEYKQEKIEAFYNIVKNYFQQHKLNLFNIQSSVIDFVSSVTELENIEKEKIDSMIDYIELEIYQDDEDMLNDKNIDLEPLIFGYSINDLESIADIIIDNNYDLSDTLKNIKKRHLLENDKEIQTYITKLERLINIKKDGGENGKHKETE